jgi:hypothetical protein
VCALLSLVAFATPALANDPDVLLIGFTGFDYQDPNPSSTYLDLGEGYKVVGFLTSAGPIIAPWIDMANFEYTLHVFDLTVSARFFASPNLTVLFANNGRGRYYADDYSLGSFTAATYGTNPPNLTSPSTFIDGSMRLGGDIDNFVLVYDFGSNNGNFGGDMTLDEGPDLIYIPIGQRAGWILGGLAGSTPSVPTGYDHQVDGECRIPGKTPTTHKTWGAVKALYR